MSFLGMAILGMWLPSRPLLWTELRDACWHYAAKTGFWLVIGFAAFLIARAADFPFVAGNAPAIGLMALLPPAANIIVLETHYSGTGESSSLIVWETILNVLAITLYVGVLVMFRDGAG